MFKKTILAVFVVFLIFVSSFPINAVSISINKNNYSQNEQTREDETNYYVVIAACSRYDDPSRNIPKILPPIPEKKLRVLYDSLLESENWNEDNIILLMNENATKENITGALESMAEIVGPNDVFLFSWQGHGGDEEDDDGDEKTINPRDEYDEAIYPHDTDTFIRDDELDYYFSKINAKGMCLIFESCLSGGLVDRGNGLGRSVNYIDEKEFGILDVNDENRVIILSTHPNTIGKASFIFGFPLTYSLARAFNGKTKDRDQDGFISAEEAFKFARPRAIIRSSLYWAGSWGSFYLIGLLSGSSNPGIEATLYLALTFFMAQYYARVLSGYFVLNWPNMHDDYEGNLPIIKC